MATEWMTYAELGERIGVSPEAARQRAMRLKLRRQVGNDGKARVAVDLEEVPLNPPKTPVDRPSDTRTDAPPTAVEQVSDTRSDVSSEHPAGDRLYDTLREQMTFLKEQLAKVEALAEQRRLEADQRRQEVEQERERTAELTDDLRKLAERVAETERTAAQAEQARADLEKAKAELAVFHAQERERADQLAGEVADLARQLARIAEDAGARERDLQSRLAKAEEMQKERDRLATDLAALLALPWWRRLFA